MIERIETPSLYPHQETLRDDARAALARHGRAILCAQTGVGKTRIAKWILGTSANRAVGEKASGKSLFAVHRRGLVDNAVGSFAESPELPHGVIMSGTDTAYGHRVQVASIDSLLAWFVEKDSYRSDLTFDLILFDEAHSHHSKLARFLEAHDARRETMGLHRAYVLGLSATPQAKGLADVYVEIVKGPSSEWLIANRFLAPYRYVRATLGRLEKLVKRGGEFTRDSEAEAMDGLAGDLVRDWKQFAAGRPTIGFFPRRSHAQDAAAQLEAAGLRVAYVDGETPDDERRVTFRSLSDGHVDYLCNVQVVERGTDIPAASCVQLCVAIGSVVRYRQCIGRGSRVHPGKQDCLVLDHGGNVARHGFFEDDPPWSLDATRATLAEQGARPTIECPKCNAIYRGGLCRVCGYEPTHRERAAIGLEFDGRELREVTREKRGKTVRTPEELMISALFAAGHTKRTWKQAVGIFLRKCEEQGSKFRVPKYVTIAGHRYETLRYGDPNGGRRVASLYPITVGGGHGGEYLDYGRPISGGSLWSH